MSAELLVHVAACILGSLSLVIALVQYHHNCPAVDLDLCFDKMEYGGAIRDPGLRIVPYVNKGNRITLLNPKSKQSGIQVKHESFNNGIRCTSTITLATEDEAFIIFEANKKPLPDTFKFKIEYLDIYKKKKVSEFKADIEREETIELLKQNGGKQ